MNATVLPFETNLAEARQRLEEAPTREGLRSQWHMDRGVLRGYYLAGAVCEVEFHAALRDLQRIYESRDALFSLQAEWRRRHHNSEEST